MCSNYLLSRVCIFCILLTVFKDRVVDARYVWVPYHKSYDIDDLKENQAEKSLEKMYNMVNILPILFSIVIKLPFNLYRNEFVLKVSYFFFRSKITIKLKTITWKTETYFYARSFLNPTKMMTEYVSLVSMPENRDQGKI